MFDERLNRQHFFGFGEPKAFMRLAFARTPEVFLALAKWEWGRACREWDEVNAAGMEPEELERFVRASFQCPVRYRVCPPLFPPIISCSSFPSSHKTYAYHLYHTLANACLAAALQTHLGRVCCG